MVHGFTLTHAWEFEASSKPDAERVLVSKSCCIPCKSEVLKRPAVQQLQAECLHRQRRQHPHPIASLPIPAAPSEPKIRELHGQIVFSFFSRHVVLARIGKKAASPGQPFGSVPGRAGDIPLSSDIFVMVRPEAQAGPKAKPNAKPKAKPKKVKAPKCEAGVRHRISSRAPHVYKPLKTQSQEALW